MRSNVYTDVSDVYTDNLSTNLGEFGLAAVKKIKTETCKPTPHLVKVELKTVTVI